MLLNNSQCFLLGAFSMLSLYFITYYFTKRSEKYNLYFAIGCVLSIIDIMNASLPCRGFNIKIDQLHFLWAPFIYIFLADSLFSGISNKKVSRILFSINIILSMFVLFVSTKRFRYDLSFDYFIISCMIYATYIYTIALIKKKQYSSLLFIANLIFIIAIVHDVLKGSGIIMSPFAEIYGYAYLIYLYVASIISANRHWLVDKKRFESEVNFLQAQIQPHFLYNTINTIIAYCRTDPEQSQQLLSELSTYLRGKFKSKNEMFVSLEDELDLIKSYLTIEQVRFKERIMVKYDIDEDCNILIPCLILQPIVENAVKHGLGPKKEGGKLEISIKKESNSMVIKIMDNGVGMNMDRLPDILEGRESGIGLSNTNERLKQYYNTDIHIKSEPNKGSEFTITIPMKRG